MKCPLCGSKHETLVEAVMCAKEHYSTPEALFENKEAVAYLEYLNDKRLSELVSPITGALVIRVLSAAEEQEFHGEHCKSCFEVTCPHSPKCN